MKNFCAGAHCANHAAAAFAGAVPCARIRDEAHRFALTLHRARRTRTGLASQLDAIPGIGPARRKALKHFGSLDGIRSAELEDLAQVRGVSRDVARAVKDVLA